MTGQRRARGDGAIYFEEARQRWVVSATVGYDAATGKRLVKRARTRTKTEARAKLREMMRSVEDGVPVTQDALTVAEAVEDWLTHGRAGRSDATRTRDRLLVERHILPHLGRRKVRDLTAQEVDVWLARLSDSLSTRTLQAVRSCLSRSITRAVARDRVRRNVVLLTELPTGRTGRPSHSLTMSQAVDVLTLTKVDPLYPYIVVSLLTGARTEEVRALRWEHAHIDGESAYLEVWRSVRATGDTKTKKSRRTLALPAQCAGALRDQRSRQRRMRLRAGAEWQDTGLVFTTLTGTQLDAANVRRALRRALRRVPGMTPADWTPRDLRHSFVSLLSEAGVPIEEISRLVGHSGTAVTELVYRHELRPVIQTGATAMDRLFGSAAGDC